jgi:hypothetical protein
MNKNYVMENFEEYNYDENIIQNLQYTNSLLNQRNISLEKELEKIKNKYNLCKQDLNNINKHISICKNNQDKIIKDLKERNDYLEQLNPNSKENNKLNSFIKKMKILFNNNNIEGEDIKDEDYLDIIGNNIIKMNEEFLLCRNELNKKIHEYNLLKQEIQNMKLNINSNIPKNYNTRVKTPIGHNKSKLNNFNKNIISFPTVDINNSPKSFRNNNNKIPIPKTPQLNPQMYKDMINNENISLRRKNNNKINIDKKLINSHSLKALNKYKNLKESNNIYQRNNIIENNNSNDPIQSLMNKVKQLEKAFDKNNFKEI